MYKGKVMALDAEERQELLDLVDNEHSTTTRFTVRTLMHTGMRATEFAHMKDDWLKRRHDVPRIQVPMHEDCYCNDCRQKAKQSKERTIEEYWRPKSESGARQIPVVHEDTWELIDSYMSANGEVGVGRGAVWSRVSKLNEDIDLDERLTPHILRHTYGTMAISRGMSIESLQGIMGHASIENTQVYLHLTGDQNAEAAARVFSG